MGIILFDWCFLILDLLSRGFSSFQIWVLFGQLSASLVGFLLASLPVIFLKLCCCSSGDRFDCFYIIRPESMVLGSSNCRTLLCNWIWGFLFVEFIGLYVHFVHLVHKSGFGDCRMGLITCL